MPYYAATNGDIAALLVGILSIVVLIVLSTILINSNIKENSIKKILFLMLFIQIIIACIDNYITIFPLMGFDARAFESLAWFSYENNVNVGRGAYNYYILNPLYKIIKVRSAITIEVLNILFNLLTNLNIYSILKNLKIKKQLLVLLIFIVALSPISLIYRTGVLRESIIIMFISYSLKSFITFMLSKKNNIEALKSFIYIGLGAIFHSGVIFITTGYLIALLSGKKNQKIFQYLILILGAIGFILFKDTLLEKVGGGDIDTIIAVNNYTSLKMAGSGYLQSITTTSLGQIVVYLPLFMFYFLYSPTPDMFRGILDIVSFILNSSIYLYFTFYGFYLYKKVKNQLTLTEKKIIKYFFISIIFTVAVFSVGTRNAGTAMRHRDKIVPLLIVIFAIIKNRAILLRERRIYERRTN
ncbi:phospholipid carrier-dependent glycosyltransferase [Fusobacterium sp.]|uniref:phospholipid carrier-dependent glycosyltransferase n=1 Tax=Fusobacterium sp. TaxID=68766 RepID=UPI0025FE0A79|nr:phospholipid carrier-dependent glycosyltransferase [Fusobacterium sp.]MDY3060764.1 hypothetical protein [Fusobacterium sp.]